MRARRRSRATCSRRFARACASSSAWGSATCRSIARRRRCRAAKRSASGWPRSSARTCRACATCWMSPPSACIRATTRSCWIRSRSCASHRNTLVVVEHDEDTIRRADHVLDLGPAAGVRGGEVVGEGTVEDLIRNPRSITGRFLREPLSHPAEPHRAVDARTPCLEARAHRAAQRAQDGRARAARPARRRHRRVRLGQVHCCARRAVHEPEAPGRRRSQRRNGNGRNGERKRRQGQGEAAEPGIGCRAHAGRRARGSRARSRPDAHRQDAALVPGHVHRLLGRDPPHLRRTPPKRASAATPRAASPSTRPAGAARAAKARA